MITHCNDRSPRQARVQKVHTPVELLTTVVSVPLKYHHAISQQGSFFRNLRSYGVQVDQSVHPQKSAIPTHPPQNAAPTARIDDAEDDVLESNWQVAPNYQDAEEGDSEWTLKAKDSASLELAQSDIKAAIEQAEAMTHAGFLTLADRSAFPRIVGTKGSNVARLRAETGADITVSRDSNVIVIIGASPMLPQSESVKLRHCRFGICCRGSEGSDSQTSCFSTTFRSSLGICSLYELHIYMACIILQTIWNGSTHQVGIRMRRT